MGIDRHNMAASAAAQRTTFGPADRERRKVEMQQCNITYGFEPLDYFVSSNNVGKVTADGIPDHDHSAMAEEMRKSSLWLQDSAHLRDTAPVDRYRSTMWLSSWPKPIEPNSMGMIIPEIKEFHRKTNLMVGNESVDYTSTCVDANKDFSSHQPYQKNLCCQTDIPKLIMGTPQCPQVPYLDYISTSTANFKGERGDIAEKNKDNIKEMRRSHFEFGFDKEDFNDTTVRKTFHRHPFTQMQENSDKVSELRQTNWELGFERTDYTTTQGIT